MTNPFNSIDDLESFLVQSHKSETLSDIVEMTREEKIEILHDIADIPEDVRSDYSGRCMYGKLCYGVYTFFPTHIIEQAAKRGLLGAMTDNMGKGYIVYWPSISGE